jgi:hypothetical protein
MIINSNLERYMDEHAHCACMVRNMFYQYSRGEITGDYTQGMCAQILVYSARDELLELYKWMSEEERSASMDWLFL